MLCNKKKSPKKRCNFQLFLCVSRCTKSGLKEIQCPSGLAFDIMKQTCDWKAKVTNCNEKESKCPLTCTLNTHNKKKNNTKILEF